MCELSGEFKRLQVTPQHLVNRVSYYVAQELVLTGYCRLNYLLIGRQNMCGKDRTEKDYVEHSFKERLTLRALFGKRSEAIGSAVTVKMASAAMRT